MQFRSRLGHQRSRQSWVTTNFILEKWPDLRTSKMHDFIFLSNCLHKMLKELIILIIFWKVNVFPKFMSQKQTFGIIRYTKFGHVTFADFKFPFSKVWGKTRQQQKNFDLICCKTSVSHKKRLFQFIAIPLLPKIIIWYDIFYQNHYKSGISWNFDQF